MTGFSLSLPCWVTPVFSVMDNLSMRGGQVEGSGGLEQAGQVPQ